MGGWGGGVAAQLRRRRSIELEKKDSRRLSFDAENTLDIAGR